MLTVFTGVSSRVKISYCLLFLWFSCAAVNADELHLIVSGKSIHFGTDTSFNEQNWGLGFEYDFEQENNWIPLITGASFNRLILLAKEGPAPITTAAWPVAESLRCWMPGLNKA